jgi:hypothetical protein
MISTASTTQHAVQCAFLLVVITPFFLAASSAISASVL